MIFITSIFLVSSASYAKADEFHMVTGAKAPYSSDNGSGFLELIAKEAFGRLGHTVKFNTLPTARAIQTVSVGKADGDMQRIGGLEKKIPNLVPVLESVSEYEFTGFSLSKNLRNLDLKDLSGSTVAYLNGWKYYDFNVPKETSTIIANTPSQLFKLLKKKRVDLVLFSRWSGYYWAQKEKVAAFAINPSFKKLKMYIYLNKKHIELAPMLARALKQMKEDGTYEKIFTKTLKQHASS
ncbi:MAG: transporter substrate-binding domain-containing protein [Sneathiella sp.]